MTFSKSSLLRQAWVGSALLLATLAHAQSISSVTGKIAGVANGWGQEGYYLILKDASATSGCTNPVGYVVQASRTDLKLIAANAMLAMATGATVRVDFQGCVFGGVGSIVGLHVNAN
jgi:hypothetical protein